MTHFRILAIAAVFAAIAVPAVAEERPVPLKDGAGRELVENNCASCHSLDYIHMNSPFLSAATWQAEVAKMIKTFGAPISDDDAKQITDYLVRNYGG